MRQYRFEGLRKFTKSQISLQRNICRYISSEPFKATFLDDLGKVLSEALKIPCSISRPEICAVAASDLENILPKLSCLVQLGVGPNAGTLIAQIDGDTAAICVDRLLGGDGTRSRFHRALTDIEEGVISFLILKTLHTLHKGFQSGRELAITLDGFGATLADIQKDLPTSGDVQTANFRINIGESMGYIRLLLPPALVGTSFCVTEDAQTTPQEWALMRRRLSSLGDKTVTARVEAARIQLSQSDLNQLEAGDIIILDNHELTKDNENFGGVVRMQIGEGLGGLIRGQLVNKEDHTRLRILDIVPQKPA